ncbi:MAG: hypothetical protein WDN04_00635 [Rhodospirillales bacterium]
MIDQVVIHPCRLERLGEHEASEQVLPQIMDRRFAAGDVLPPHQEHQHPIHAVPVQALGVGPAVHVRRGFRCGTGAARRAKVCGRVAGGVHWVKTS